MNYMAEVANMLGVELGEEFKCDNGYKYMFTEKGVISHDFVRHGLYLRPDEEAEHYVNILMSLLNGSLTIISKPWHPNKNDIFWSVDAVGNAMWGVWQGTTQHLTYYKLGNCYRTQEEAEANRGKWISFYASDEVLDV